MSNSKYREKQFMDKQRKNKISNKDTKKTNNINKETITDNEKLDNDITSDTKADKNTDIACNKDLEKGANNESKILDITIGELGDMEKYSDKNNYEDLTDDNLKTYTDTGIIIDKKDNKINNGNNQENTNKNETTNKTKPRSFIDKIKYIFKDSKAVEKSILDYKHLLFSLLMSLLINVISKPTQDISMIRYISNVLVDGFELYSIFFIALFLGATSCIFLYGNIFFVLLSVANNLLLKYRGTPFTVYDSLMVEEGFALAKDFMSGKEYYIALLLVFLFITITTNLFRIFIGFKRVKTVSLSLTAILAMLLTPSFYDIKKEKTIAYGESGFIEYVLYNFLEEEVDKPDNYSKSKINEIKKELNSIPSISNTNKPNIVAVQLESFIDIKDIEGINLSENPTPYIDSLKENYSNGYINVSTFGGGTAISEFEFLTGMNSKDFASGIIPHNTFLLKQAVESLPNDLRNEGYTTHLIHNYLGDFYDRDYVYKNLGFDTFTSKELIYYSAWHREYIHASKDEVFAREIPNVLKNNEGREFVFGITAQLHAPYDETIKEYENGITASGGLNNQDAQLTDYANRLKTIDNMVKDLISEIEKIDEPTVVVFYSDHLPALDFTGSNIESSKYKAPYFIWGNIGLEQEVKDIDISDLLIDTLVKSNVEAGYLTKLYRIYKESSAYTQYKTLLSYDTSFGENYIGKEKAKTLDTKYGHSDISVTSAEKISDNEYLIKGWNFTEYINVMCNGNSYGIEYLGPGEIKIKTTDNLVGKKAYLEVKIGNRKESVAKSKTFKIN
jgi:hypothetical protein